MSRLFVGKINVEKINKEKFFKGEKGTYLDITIWLDDQENQYGTIASIQQSQTKEEREGGAEKIFLGNLKEIQLPSNDGGFDNLNANVGQAAQPQAPAAQVKEDLPF